MAQPKNNFQKDDTIILFDLDNTSFGEVYACKTEALALLNKSGFELIHVKDHDHGEPLILQGKTCTVTIWQYRDRKNDTASYHASIELSNGAKATRHYDGTVHGPSMMLADWVNDLCAESIKQMKSRTSPSNLFSEMEPAIIQWLAKSIQTECSQCRSLDGGYTNCDLHRPCFAKDAIDFLDMYDPDWKKKYE